jgi:hypothetical protein
VKAVSRIWSEKVGDVMTRVGSDEARVSVV